jgi:hypothetical protein
VSGTLLARTSAGRVAPRAHIGWGTGTGSRRDAEQPNQAAQVS